MYTYVCMHVNACNCVKTVKFCTTHDFVYATTTTINHQQTIITRSLLKKYVSVHQSKWMNE